MLKSEEKQFRRVKKRYVPPQGFTLDQVKDIRDRRGRGQTLKRISLAYSVSVSTIFKICDQ